MPYDPWNPVKRAADGDQPRIRLFQADPALAPQGNEDDALARDRRAGARLRAAREAAGFSSIADAARAFDFHKQNLGDHEAGRRRIHPEHAIQYGHAFSVDPAWIVFGDIRLQETDLARMVPVVGQITSPSLVSDDGSFTAPDEVPVELPDYVRAPLSAFYVRFDSGGHRRGSFLITCPTQLTGIRAGDTAVARRATDLAGFIAVKAVDRRDEQDPQREVPRDEWEVIGVVVQTIAPREGVDRPLLAESNLLLTDG